MLDSNTSAAFLAAVFENLATSFGTHAFEKAMNSSAFGFFGLKGTFHNASTK